MNLAELDRIERRLQDLDGAVFQVFSSNGDYTLRIRWYGETVYIANEEELDVWLEDRKQRMKIQSVNGKYL